MSRPRAGGVRNFGAGEELGGIVGGRLGIRNRGK